MPAATELTGKRRENMGKPTGFLDYERKGSQAEAPLQRIRHFNEFHTPLSEEQQKEQGARCMECGEIGRAHV